MAVLVSAKYTHSLLQSKIDIDRILATYIPQVRSSTPMLSLCSASYVGSYSQCYIAGMYSTHQHVNQQDGHHCYKHDPDDDGDRQECQLRLVLTPPTRGEMEVSVEVILSSGHGCGPQQGTTRGGKCCTLKGGRGTSCMSCGVHVL